MSEPTYESRIVCDGCGQEIDYLQIGMVHEILHNIEDRFPEYCGRIIEIPAEAPPIDGPAIEETFR